MPKLKTLSGVEVVEILVSFGFKMVSQRGSHVKLRRILPDGAQQTLTIPMHAELSKGTLLAIYRQALHYIPEAELHLLWYTD